LPFKRKDEIAVFYQEADFAKACSFVLGHGITHVALGKIERDFYPNLAVNTLRQLGMAVAESGESALIEVDPARCDPADAS
jgi:hypothetical protein